MGLSEAPRWNAETVLKVLSLHLVFEARSLPASAAALYTPGDQLHVSIHSACIKHVASSLHTIGKYSGPQTAVIKVGTVKVCVQMDISPSLVI